MTIIVLIMIFSFLNRKLKFQNNIYNISKLKMNNNQSILKKKKSKNNYLFKIFFFIKMKIIFYKPKMIPLFKLNKNIKFSNIKKYF